MNYVKNCLIITMLVGIGYADCPAMGDVNDDEMHNVLDIVMLRNCILQANCYNTPTQGCNADMNWDGAFNVLDLVALANCILAQNCDEPQNKL